MRLVVVQQQWVGRAMRQWVGRRLSQSATVYQKEVKHPDFQQQFRGRKGDSFPCLDRSVQNSTPPYYVISDNTVPPYCARTLVRL